MPSRQEARYVKLVAQLDKAEADMRRAMNRWSKVRAQVRRAEKALDREFTVKANMIGGKCDVRDLEFDDSIDHIGG